MKKTSVLVTPENAIEVIALINETMSGKTYWLDVAGYGKVSSIKEYCENDDFLGRGTFYRTFTASAALTNKIYLQDKAIKINYNHDGLKQSPSEGFFDIGFELEVIIEGNDILIFAKNNTNMSPNGGTIVYLEKTEERIKFWHQKHGVTA